MNWQIACNVRWFNEIEKVVEETKMIHMGENSTISNERPLAFHNRAPTLNLMRTKYNPEHKRLLSFYEYVCLFLFFFSFFSSFSFYSFSFQLSISIEICSTWDSCEFQKTKKKMYINTCYYTFAMMSNRNLRLSTWQLQTNQKALSTIQYEKCTKS